MPCEFISGDNCSAEAAEPGEPGDLIYDVVVGVCGVAVTVQRAGRHRGGVADSEPAGSTVGGVDWVFREHAGDAGKGGQGEEFPGVAGGGAGDGVGGISASGCAV